MLTKPPVGMGNYLQVALLDDGEDIGLAPHQLSETWIITKWRQEVGDNSTMVWTSQSEHWFLPKMSPIFTFWQQMMKTWWPHRTDLVPGTCSWDSVTMLSKANNSCFHHWLQYFASTDLCERKNAIRSGLQHPPSTEEILMVEVEGSPWWDVAPFPSPESYSHTRPFSFLLLHRCWHTQVPCRSGMVLDLKKREWKRVTYAFKPPVATEKNQPYV